MIDLSVFDREKYIMESLNPGSERTLARVLSMQVERQGGAILPRAAGLVEYTRG